MKGIVLAHFLICECFEFGHVGPDTLRGVGFACGLMCTRVRAHLGWVSTPCKPRALFSSTLGRKLLTVGVVWGFGPNKICSNLGVHRIDLLRIFFGPGLSFPERRKRSEVAPNLCLKKSQATPKASLQRHLSALRCPPGSPKLTSGSPKPYIYHRFSTAALLSPETLT